MPNVAHIGPKIYAHRMEYPSRDFPIMERGDTQEIDWPFRTGKAIVARLPFTRRAVVLGVWVGQQFEDEALTDAIKARSIDYGSIEHVG